MKRWNGVISNWYVWLDQGLVFFKHTHIQTHVNEYYLNKCIQLHWTPLNMPLFELIPTAILFGCVRSIPRDFYWVDELAQVSKRRWWDSNSDLSIESSNPLSHSACDIRLTNHEDTLEIERAESLVAWLSDGHCRL